MRRSTKKKVIPLALALALALIGAALAVPTIGVHVQKIGAGGPQVIQSDIGAVAINWNLDPDNPDYLNNISVSIDNSSAVGTLYVKFYNGGTLEYLATIDLNGNSEYLITSTNSNITFPIDLSAFDVDSIAVVYQGPTVTP